MHQDPIIETSSDLGLNDNEEIENLKRQLEYAQREVRELKIKIGLLQKWYTSFEDFTHWMLLQGMWGAEDIVDDNLTQTYKNGLIRFCKKHNIKLNE